MNMNPTRTALILAAIIAMSGPARAEDARQMADRINIGDDKVMVAAKLGQQPTWTESSRWPFVDNETLAFRINSGELLTVKLVAGRVYSVAVQPFTPWVNTSR